MTWILHIASRLAPLILGFHGDQGSIVISFKTRKIERDGSHAWELVVDESPLLLFSLGS